ncbi:Serine hydrolase-like protein [Halotydeus destructor]|nr:Serine hydrolase-like protein [Halotydeus destructor]
MNNILSQAFKLQAFRPKLVTLSCITGGQNPRFSLTPGVLAKRMSSTTSGDFLPHLEGKEIEIPTSFGYIRGKEYGDPHGHPTLCIHGWLDNIGSFDPIIPYLMQAHNLHIVAIDEAGCGLSSHKPPGSDYSRWSHLIEMKRVIDHMKWKEITLIGHSLGAIYSFLFSAIYPDIVKRMVTIDIPKPATSVGEQWAVRLPKVIEKHLQYDNFYINDPTLEKTAKVYTYEQAVRKLTEGHGNSLTEESGRILMKRGAKQFKDGWTFTRDIRQNLPTLAPAPKEETMLRFMWRIKCDLLIIRARQSPYHVPESVRRQYYEIYERNCRLFRDVLMDGTHHLHMNNPDKVAKALNEFLGESFYLQSGFTSTPKSNL